MRFLVNAFIYSQIAQNIRKLTCNFVCSRIKDLHPLRSPESKNQSFNGWFVYLSVSLSLSCVLQAYLKIKLKQKLYIRHFKFISCIADSRKILWRSHEESVYRGKQKYSNILRPKDRIPCWYIFTYLGWTVYNEINIHFLIIRKLVTNGVEN